MAKNIEAYGELTLAMKKFEDLQTIVQNPGPKSWDASFLRAHQKAKADLGNLLVELMIQNKIEIVVK